MRIRIAIALATLLALGVYGSALLPDLSFTAMDLPFYFYPMRARMGEALREGRLILWDPLVACGRPFLADPTTQSFYPGTLLFAVFGPILAMKLFLVLHAALAALTMSTLARRLDATPVASALAGACFAAAGPVVGAHSHPLFSAALPWLPFALCGVVGLTRDDHRSARLADAARVAGGTALVALAGAFDMLLAFALLVPALSLALLTGAPRPGLADAARRVARVGAAGLLGTALAAVQIVPTLELVSQSNRVRENVAAESASFSIDAAALAREATGLAAPSAATNPGGQPGEGRLLTATYLGVPVLLLGLLGLVGGAAPVALRVLLAVFVAAALALALGDATPLFELARSLLPGFSLFRYTEKFLVLVPLGLAPLAALGLDRALRGRPRVASLVAVGIAVDLVIRAHAAIPLEPTARLYAPSRAVEEIRRLERAGASGRVIRGPGLRVSSEAPNPNHLALYGFRVASSYSSIDLAAMVDVARSTDFEGLVRATASEIVGLRDPGGPHAVRWVRVAGALPRAFVAASPDGEPLQGSWARIVRDDETTVELEVDAPAAGAYLVLLDARYPGWRAERDGSATPIESARLGFRAVALDGAGRHRVRFDFAPASLWLGVVISALAALSAGATLAVARRRGGSRRGEGEWR